MKLVTYYFLFYCLTNNNDLIEALQGLEEELDWVSAGCQSVVIVAVTTLGVLYVNAWGWGSCVISLLLSALNFKVRKTELRITNTEKCATRKCATGKCVTRKSATGKHSLSSPSRTREPLHELRGLLHPGLKLRALLFKLHDCLWLWLWFFTLRSLYMLY